MFYGYQSLQSEKFQLLTELLQRHFCGRRRQKKKHYCKLTGKKLTDMIVLGEVEKISGKHGQVMQLRPKAAHSKVKTAAFNKNGEPFQTLPRGFYLKIPFTHMLIKKHLIVG